MGYKETLYGNKIQSKTVQPENCFTEFSLENAGQGV